MPDVNDPETLGIIPCAGCFRRSDKAHCPKCGSYDNRVLVSKKARIPHPQTGVMTDNASYKCHRCGLTFTDFDWQFNCHAPEYVRKRNMRIQSNKTKKQYAIDQAALDKGIEVLKKKYGIKPKNEGEIQ